MTQKLPRWGKFIYGTGAGGWSLIDRVMITWLYYYYITSPAEGVEALMPPLLFSGIMLGGRIVDAVADPVIARFSDNLDSRIGRRMPFLLLSGVLYVGVFIALFFPPVEDISVWNGVYLGVMLGFYFILFTAYVNPYLALLPELSRTNRDRVDLSTFKALFFLVGNAIGMVGIGAAMYRFGFHGAIVAMAVIGLVFLYLPALIRERRYAVAKPSTMSLVTAVRTTFKNRAFLIYLAGNNAFWFGFNIIVLNIALYVTVLLGLPEGETATFMAAAFGVAAVSFPLINILSKKRGLKAGMLFSLLLFAVFLPLIFFVGRPVLGLEPSMFTLVVMGLAGIPLAGLFIVPDAIVAAVSDLEVKLSGERREAMYFGTQGLLLKVNLGISTLVSGGLLQFFGEPLGIQLTGPVAGFFILVGLLIFLRYPEKEVVAFQKGQEIDEERIRV